MSKRKQHFDKIAEYKERFQNLPTEKIRLRLRSCALIKEAAIALREILEERESTQDEIETIFDSNTN